MTTQLSGAWQPSGSYTTINHVLNTPSPAPKPPDQDVHVTFDNNQKVGFASGRIREGSTVPMSICTAVTYIFPTPASNLQQTSLNASTESIEVRMQNVKIFEQQCNDHFLKYRSSYIQEVINRVKDEQVGMSDYIDTAVVQQSLGQKNDVCTKCSYVYPVSQNRICPQCKHDPDHHQLNYDPYYRTKSQVSSDKPIIVIGDPCMVNPSSKKSVKEVLFHLKKECDVPEKRKWIVVWSDGVPYLFMCKLLESLFICNVCGQEVDKYSEPLVEHINMNHQGMNVDFNSVFDGIIPMTGPGHFELNFSKMLLSLGWYPMLSNFATLLGFRSQKAQHVIRVGSNHHRSRQILQSLLVSLLRVATAICTFMFGVFMFCHFTCTMKAPEKK